MTTLKSPQKNAKKSWPQYTRISLNQKLQATIAEIQLDLPLFTVNDTINFLISKGYQQWRLEQGDRLNADASVAQKNTLLIHSDSYKWLENEGENTYSIDDGEPVK